MEDSIQQLLTKKRGDIVNRTRWTKASVLNRIETAYGFFVDYRKPNNT